MNYEYQDRFIYKILSISHWDVSNLVESEDILNKFVFKKTDVWSYNLLTGITLYIIKLVGTM